MLVVVMVMDRILIVVMMIVVMILSMIVVMTVLVTVLVVVIMVVTVPFDIDIKLGRADATPIDSPDPECKPTQTQFSDLTFQQFEIETGANHCTNEHVATDAGKTVEIKSPCHIPYSNEPAMMVVATSGCRYLCIASLTCALVTAFTIPGNLSR